jgi:predicted nucleotidyltransferase
LTADSELGFLDALAALVRGLEDSGASSMIIGGVAVIALGVPRLTVDIDATVAAAQVDVERLAEALSRQRIRPRIEDAVAFAKARQVFLGVHEPSGTPIDVSLAWLPFEEEALRAGEERDFGGITIRVPRAEDLVIYKLVAARPQDLDDAEGLLVLHGPSMDLDRVRRTVREFAAVLEDADRPAALEALLRKTGLG